MSVYMLRTTASPLCEAGGTAAKFRDGATGPGSTAPSAWSGDFRKTILEIGSAGVITGSCVCATG